MHSSREVSLQTYLSFTQFEGEYIASKINCHLNGSLEFSYQNHLSFTWLKVGQPLNSPFTCMPAFKITCHLHGWREISLQNNLYVICLHGSMEVREVFCHLTNRRILSVIAIFFILCFFYTPANLTLLYKVQYSKVYSFLFE